MVREYVLTVSDSGYIAVEKVTGKPNGDDIILNYMHENAELKRKLKQVKECVASMSNMVDALEVGLGN